MHFVVMNNVNAALYTAAGGSLDSLADKTGLQAESYDLKGSWVARAAGDGAGTKKDLDLTSEVVIGEEQHCALMAQLEYDTKWLEAWNIMDYSMLVTIVQPEGGRTGQNASRWCVAHTCCDESTLSGTSPSRRSTVACRETHDSSVQNTLSCLDQRDPLVCIGLIDVLQKFDCSKRGELVYKSVVNWSEQEGLSCISPVPYRKRFMTRMRDTFVTCAH